jgi:superfamily II DNA/RNA helicase
MMFSATLPAEVRGLVAKYLSSPSRIAVGEENKPVARIQQDVIELYEHDKDDTLMREIDKAAGSIIVFCKTKLRTDLVASMLQEKGHKVAPLHGDLGQSLRRRVTNAFRDGEIRILVATDIAARGLDIDHVRHVINYDLPMLPEDYVHRIGRTGRNGAEGHSVALVTPQEKHRWGQILKLIRGGSSATASGAKGYKNASSRGAFSSDARRKPFTSAYMGPTESDLRASGTPSRGAKRKPAPQPRSVKPVRGAPPVRGAGGAAGSNREARRKDAANSAHAQVRRAGKASTHGGYMTSEARNVREDFQARVEKAEGRRADQLGRKPRFTQESNLRRAAGKTAVGPASGASQVSGKKPHKGAPDMRKRRKLRS